MILKTVPVEKCWEGNMGWREIFCFILLCLHTQVKESARERKNLKIEERKG